MKTAIPERKELNTIKQVSATLERIRASGKSATRRALKELKEIYNSFNSKTLKGSMLLKNPELVREEVYQKYYPYFQRGIY